MESKYLEFRFVEKKPKTRVYEVASKEYGYRLGLVKYYPAWRQYCFFPEQGMVFSSGCLQDIQLFMNHEEELRKLI